jgi:hypothetical protein
MENPQKKVNDKLAGSTCKVIKESKLTLEIVEALKEVKQMQDGKISPLKLQDI